MNENTVPRRGKNQRCAALVEYVLIIAGVALVGAVAISVFGNEVSDMLTTVAAVLPGAHPDDNAPVVTGRIIETPLNAQGTDSGGNNQQGIGFAVNSITQSQGQLRLGQNIGGDGSVSALVLDPSR